MMICRRAITLPEVLVVLAIIAILAGLIVGSSRHPGGGRHKQAYITLELLQMGGAIEEFGHLYGEYPPNLMANSNQRS